MVFRGIIIAAIVFVSSLSYAAPAITVAEGTWLNNRNVKITGTGFGTKTEAKPLIWADFETNANPTSLGTKTSWDTSAANGYYAQSSTSPRNGSYCLGSTGSWGSYSFTTSAQTGIGNSGKLYIHVWRRQTHDQYTGNNWKILRIWYQSGSNATTPDIHNGWPSCCGADGGQFTCEVDCDSDYFTLTAPTSTWKLYEYIIQMSSGANQADGIIHFTVDGTSEFDSTTYKTSCEANEQPNWVFIEDDPSNLTPAPTGEGSFFDDIYIDTTWSRVMVCSGSTWAARGVCNIQIPSSWSATSISVKVNRASGTGTQYLYVVDSDNAANSSGYAITWGTTVYKHSGGGIMMP